MIQSIVAFTYEIDFPDKAVEELLKQLEPLTEFKDKYNMIGIVTCSYDYIESGIIKSLSNALDFDIIGMTTISQAISKTAGMLLLTLTVLYSEDCNFVAGVTTPIPQTGDIRACVSESYLKMSEKLPEKEKLIIIFTPLLPHQSGDKYVNILSSLSSHVPIFGSIAIDDNVESYENSYTIYNEVAYKDCMSFMLISGNLSPEFKLYSILNESTLPYKGEITDSEGNILKKINDLPLVSFFETIGLASDGKLRNGINSIPFLINFETESGYNNIPVARALFLTTSENYGVCGGDMPIGSSLTLGECSKDTVISTMQYLTDEISEKYLNRTVLIFSCIGRKFALMAEHLKEIEFAQENMPKNTNFMLSYSGGEFCPTDITDGKTVNRFHNYSLVACVL